MVKHHFKLQKEVCRDVLQDVVLTSTASYQTFSANDDNWQNIIRDNKKFATMFCSIQVARYNDIYGSLSAVLLPHRPYTDGILNWNQYASVIPANLLLNPQALILPYNHIVNNKKHIQDIYGDNLFIKPNSPWKPFTGFITHISQLEYELNSYKSCENVRGSELAIITNTKQFDAIEYRCWCIDGKFVTSAPYSWFEMENIPDTPKEVISLATNVLEYIEEYYMDHVIDIAMTNDGPKVIELNGVSTSGWYQGMDAEKLLTTIAGQYE